METATAMGRPATSIESNEHQDTDAQAAEAQLKPVFRARVGSKPASANKSTDAGVTEGVYIVLVFTLLDDLNARSHALI